MKTSCYVISAAYSGTTLFSSIMDTQPKVRGIGEAVRHIHRGPRSQNPWCASCNGLVDACQRKPQIEGNRIHEAYFEHYPDTDVLVDISKSWVNCFRWQSTPYKIKIISMAKWPHAFAWSQLNHFRRRNEPRTVAECFDAWIKAYESAVKLYDAATSWTLRRKVALGERIIMPHVSADDFLEITYHDLVLNTADTVKRVCKFLETDFDEENIANWWRVSDTCTVGGNQAVYAQKTNELFFTDDPTNPDREYLNGKYLGQRGQIFFDMSWKDDHEFCADAHAAYYENRKTLRPLVKMFGLVHYKQCLKALDSPCSFTSAVPGISS